MSLVDTTQQVLEAAMSGSELRQTLLTNNLANVDTPGYQPEDVDFQSTLQNALSNGQPVDQTSFQPYTRPAAAGPDGNGVSANQQEAYMAENGLLYETLTQIAAQREHIMLSAMGMGGGS
jgi:flagellar basal-body rod protein FlgB